MENNNRTIVALRKCGHFLHHTANRASGIDEETLLSVLTDEERETLASLLEKCLDNWKTIEVKPETKNAES